MKLHLAKKSHRFINSIIDMISVCTIWFIIILTIILTDPDQSSTEEITNISIFIMIPIFWGYYFLLELLFQRTLGKVLTKTKVVNELGSKPNYKQIIGRTLSRSIPFEYLSYLVNSTGVHDKLSGTRVVVDN